MWPSRNFGALALLSTLTIGSCTVAGPANGFASITGLRPFLSQEASITYNRSTIPRWSDFHAPTPGAIINVATENDVAATVSAIYRIPMVLSLTSHAGQILQQKQDLVSRSEWRFRLELKLGLGF